MDSKLIASFVIWVLILPSVAFAETWKVELDDPTKPAVVVEKLNLKTNLEVVHPEIAFTAPLGWSIRYFSGDTDRFILSPTNDFKSETVIISAMKCPVKPCTLKKIIQRDKTRNVKNIFKIKKIGDRQWLTKSFVYKNDLVVTHQDSYITAEGNTEWDFILRVPNEKMGINDSAFKALLKSAKLKEVKF